MYTFNVIFGLRDYFLGSEDFGASFDVRKLKPFSLGFHRGESVLSRRGRTASGAKGSLVFSCCGALKPSEILQHGHKYMKLTSTCKVTVNLKLSC
jgi:hypothetical protein